VSHLNEVRLRARTAALRFRSLAVGNIAARAILDAAQQDTGVRLFAVGAGDPLLDGGEAVYDPDPKRIWYNCEVEPEVLAMHQAHEFAHVLLQHAGRSNCKQEDLDAESPENPVPLGIHRVEGYSPMERRERDANVFARELLLPTDLLRTWFLEEGLTASEIAGRVGVPIGVVYHQLAFALLVGDLPRVASEEAAPAITLDKSQEEAAFIASGPVLVEAGPGTGKTRTLVARVVHLLGQGVDPNEILALTFSNKAAEEMRSRIAAVAPDAAPLIWIGTFHAFGLELLRKHGSSIGLPPDPAVLDPVDGMLLLERELPNLRLEHYQYLPEPTLYLKDILTAISRAKDELVEPEGYRRAALAMREAARGEEEVVAAEKALEVADVYQAYQSFLERDQALDFGDLISRSVGLLGASADVREEVRSRFRFVLVDEYQDVNRASARLLQAIAGDGKGLWVVGDARQSIYRFRGAAPANMATFADDFPGAVMLWLADSYRTQPAVLKAVNAYAAAMPALPGRPFEPWTPRRAQTNGRVTMEIAADAEAEGLGIAAEIQEHVRRSVPYRDHAVLCRSHLNLARLGEYLERAGIPVLYLGDLFERPEIRDLLALLSLMCFRDGKGLVRVARFPDYDIPLADVRALYRFASEQKVAFPDALARAAAADQSPVGTKGRPGVALLASHLERFSFGTEAWTMLVQYLLEDAGYLRRLAADQSAGGQQRRLAVYQFLQFAQEQRRRSGLAGGVPHNVDPKRMFLQLVRRLAMLGDDSQLRQVPEWAADIDAVRLLTVHSSKGLEFPVVFVPVLAKGRFPAGRQWNRCPLPPALLGVRDEGADHEQEEECLLFVAVSRARDVLCLSRALSYSSDGKGSNPSPLLARLAPVLLEAPDGLQPTWTATGTGAATALPSPPAGSTGGPYRERTLETYGKCPKRYYYEEVLGLSSGRDDSAYLDMHGCVHQVLHWHAAERDEGRIHDPESALRQLDLVWTARKRRPHPYDLLYKAVAENLVTAAAEEAGRRRATKTLIKPEWTVALTHGSVLVTPDEVELVEQPGRQEVTVRRIRTGRPTKTEGDKPVYALYHEAAQRAYPGAQVRVEIAYLATRTTTPVEMKASTRKSRVAKYDTAMAGIGSGDFSAAPDDFGCPRCPHYFICPSAEDGIY